MKISKSLLSAAIVGMLMTSCGEEPKTSEKEAGKEEVSTPEVVENTITTFSVLPETAEVKWIGFKLAEKVGVNGAFENFTMTGYHNEAASIKDLMIGTSVSIVVGSTKTGDEARDGKIIASFFGSMLETENIVATLKSLKGETEGKATVAITMNGKEVEKELDWSYTKDNFTFLLHGNINVPDWEAQVALDALNTVCEEKHRGEGDVAVTWPDVDISAYVLIDEKVQAAP